MLKNLVISQQRRTFLTSPVLKMQVYVGNLNWITTEKDLAPVFTRFGPIAGVRVQREPKTGRPRGFAFVDFINNEDAKKALAVHGQVLNDRSLVVREAKLTSRN